MGYQNTKNFGYSRGTSRMEEGPKKKAQVEDKGLMRIAQVRGNSENLDCIKKRIRGNRKRILPSNSLDLRPPINGQNLLTITITMNTFSLRNQTPDTQDIASGLAIAPILAKSCMAGITQ